MTLSRLIPWRQRPPIVIDATALAMDLEAGAVCAARRQSDVRVVPRMPVMMHYETVGIRK